MDGNYDIVGATTLARSDNSENDTLSKLICVRWRKMGDTQWHIYIGKDHASDSCQKYAYLGSLACPKSNLVDPF
jgi:hypothetical protein